MDQENSAKRGRGRPKGSKTKFVLKKDNNLTKEEIIETIKSLDKKIRDLKKEKEVSEKFLKSISEL